MIGVKLDGRMGNQMFQYAFALARARERKTQFFVDQIMENFILTEYFLLPSYQRWYNSLLTKFYYKFSNKKTSIYSCFDSPDPSSWTSNYFVGFFQSEKYF
jgi:hypothetical protein